MKHSYSVKNVKTFMGREGEGFNATLYRGKKKIANVYNMADGGIFSYDFFDSPPNTKRVSMKVRNFQGKFLDNVGTPEENLLQEFVNQLPKDEQYGFFPDMDTFIDDLVYDFLNDKKFDRLSKTKILFRTTDTPKGNWSVIKMPYSDKLASQLKAQFGKKLLEVYIPTKERK